MKKRVNRGLVFLAVGFIFIFAALGWYIFNLYEDKSAGLQSKDILYKLEQNMQKDTPVSTVDGDDFCGKIIIESLGIELPVFDQWDYKRLKKSPCRYSGSIESEDIIIAGHNYNSHFGQLIKLESDDEIIFVDIYGASHRYIIKEKLLLDGTAVTDMKAGEWDFTLFTCTKSGKQRVTLRCEKIE